LLENLLNFKQTVAFLAKNLLAFVSKFIGLGSIACK
jgi:hypothetical protein